MELGIFKCVAAALLFSVSVQASTFLKKSQTPEEQAQALQLNQIFEANTRRPLAPPVGQPALETDHFRYLLLSGETFEYDTDEKKEMHRLFAQNLPADMILVVVTEQDDALEVKNAFSQWIDSKRLIIASGDNLGNITWGRDSYPIPVYKDNQKTVELVAHDYFRTFNARKLIADSVQAQNVKYEKFVYVGGNLMAAENGDCFAVNSGRIFGLSDNTFMNSFRCRSITRLPYVAGIGDVDEVIKILPNKNILTNQTSYKSIFTKMGYTVTMLPEVYDSYRTYANSVILNKTVFMPSFENATQNKAAAAVYASFGYKVIEIPSNFMSDEMAGSVHCLTMAYPDMDLTKFFKQMGLKQIY